MHNITVSHFLDFCVSIICNSIIDQSVATVTIATDIVILINPNDFVNSLYQYLIFTDGRKIFNKTSPFNGAQQLLFLFVAINVIMQPILFATKFTLVLLVIIVIVAIVFRAIFYPTCAI